MSDRSRRPGVLVFDVNETLLDLSGMRPRVAAVLGDGDATTEWFVRMLHGSLVANHLGSHRPFGEIGADALRSMAHRRGIALDPAEAAAVVDGMRRLPAHPDVPGSLDLLAQAGFRMAALSNGSADMIADQLDHAGIGGRFERMISVDVIGRFKPAPEVYLHAAVMLGVEIDAAMMVAAHDWDVLGATSVGMAGAFIARPGAAWGPAARPPAVVAADLRELAHILAEGV